MKKLPFIILLCFGFQAAALANEKKLNLEAWFDTINRNQIQYLHKRLKADGGIDMGGYDYTTVWDVRHQDYNFENLRVVRVLTDSMDSGWMGCCYSHAAGLILEIEPKGDLTDIAKKYDCYIRDDSFAINGLSFHNHAVEGKSYIELRCLGGKVITSS